MRKIEYICFGRDIMHPRVRGCGRFTPAPPLLLLRLNPAGVVVFACVLMSLFFFIMMVLPASGGVERVEGRCAPERQQEPQREREPQHRGYGVRQEPRHQGHRH